MKFVSLGSGSSGNCYFLCTAQTSILIDAGVGARTMRRYFRDLGMQMGKEYHKRRTYHTHTKGAQEAHEAIRPTDMRRAEIEGTAQERRLYALIRKRTLACQMADALIEKTTAVIAIDGKPETFVANGEVVKFDGFLRVYADSRYAGDGEGDDAPGMLPQMSEGETACATEISARERFSAAPARYNEASLVHKLEELSKSMPLL